MFDANVEHCLIMKEMFLKTKKRFFQLIHSELFIIIKKRTSLHILIKIQREKYDKDNHNLRMDEQNKQ